MMVMMMIHSRFNYEIDIFIHYYVQSNQTQFVHGLKMNIFSPNSPDDKMPTGLDLTTLKNSAVINHAPL
jgi:hypothetical protein